MVEIISKNSWVKEKHQNIAASAQGQKQVKSKIRDKRFTVILHTAKFCPELVSNSSWKALEVSQTVQLFPHTIEEKVSSVSSVPSSAAAPLLLFGNLFLKYKTHIQFSHPLIMYL